MSELASFSNLFLDLADGAYENKPKRIAESSDIKESKEIDFSKSYIKGDKVVTEGGNVTGINYTLYLQPDPGLHEYTKKFDVMVPKENGGYDIEQHEGATFHKGLMTDEEAGFNSYFLTDTSELNQDTKHTYFAIRGSDPIEKGNLNDWVGNDLNFAFRDAHLPQAKLATEAMKGRIEEMAKEAPNATMSVTGHSLGTFISVQGLAKLSME